MSLSSIRMMDTFTRMIRRNFPLEEHRFLYWDNLRGDDRKLLNYGNSVAVTGTASERAKKVREEMERADVIVWHGIMFGAKRAIMLLLYPKLLRKSIWVMRGIDLYNWRKEKKGIKAWAINKINYLVRKGMPNVAAIFRTDEAVYREQFGPGAKVFYLPYPIAESAFELMENYRGCGPRPNGKVYVQVAHNAYAFNRHLEILEGIRRFKNENLRVIVPLSYGNDWGDEEKNYYRTVATKAQQYFGSKAICLKRLMPANEYSELLCNVDISIYGAPRQNALGNILRSLYMGNKVFLSNKNPLYHYFKECGIDVYEMERIPKMSYQEFCKRANPNSAVDWIRRNYYPDSSAVYWGAMFESLRTGEDVSDEKIDEQISAVLERDFTDVPVSRKTKKNYMDLGRYIEHPKGTVYANVKDLMILGAGAIGLQILQGLLKTNAKGTRWAIKGFADYQIKTLGSSMVYDVVGTPDQISGIKNMQFINAVENSSERRRAVQAVLAGGGTLIQYTSAESRISSSVSRGFGCTFIGNCTILGGTSIGRCSLLKSSFVDYAVYIGNYCTLERNCWIGEGAIIEDGVVIGDCSKIAPGVRIGRGQVIPPFSEITQDVV